MTASTTTGLELATSWSLKHHYTRDLTEDPFYSPGRSGTAICGARLCGFGIEVYTDEALIRRGFTVATLARPRTMCTWCEHLAAATT